MPAAPCENPVSGPRVAMMEGQAAPWVMVWFYRWFVPQIQLPNGKQVRFEGTAPGEIWYILMLAALLGYAGAVHQALPILLIPLNAFFTLLTIRLVTSKLRWDGQHEPLRFTGSYLGLLGWLAFLVVSFISIIGWAWVTTAMARWLCRNVEGSSEQLSFVASGWGILWRFFVFSIACLFIIPIPWMVAWLVRWLISQYHLSPRT